MKNAKLKRMASIALLMALVVVMQFISGLIPPISGFSISLVLIPIVIGAATCGPLISTWLGLVFGLAVLMSGDAAAFLVISVPGTVLTVLLKGMLCGLLAGLTYQLLERLDTYAAVFAAAFVCPVVNTAVFLLGCRLFFWETIGTWAAAMSSGSTVAYALLVLVGANFLFELGFNMLLSPLVVRLLHIRRKQTS